MLAAPFPWFGGKSRAAPIIWEAFGAGVGNYVEPFAGSLAVLLGRPGTKRGVETVNDADGFLSNFWRAIAADPEAVAIAADWPVNEVDLTARHLWLVERRAALTQRLQVDPDHYDAKIAGWWVWGQCCWIGSGWCSGDGPWTTDGERWIDRRQLPHLGTAGQGVNRQLPQLVNAGRVAKIEYFADLSARLTRVRVACGDWSRVLELRYGQNTAILLDPPYPDGFDADAGCYSAGGGANVWHAAAAWAADAGKDRALRIALCGYAGCWTPPAGWREASWKARGGYASFGGGENGNARRERIWFSPGCLTGNTLFDESPE